MARLHAVTSLLADNTMQQVGWWGWWHQRGGRRAVTGTCWLAPAASCRAAAAVNGFYAAAPRPASQPPALLPASRLTFPQAATRTICSWLSAPHGILSWQHASTSSPWRRPRPPSTGGGEGSRDVGRCRCRALSGTAMFYRTTTSAQLPRLNTDCSEPPGCLLPARSTLLQVGVERGRPTAEHLPPGASAPDVLHRRCSRGAAARPAARAGSGRAVQLSWREGGQGKSAAAACERQWRQQGGMCCSACDALHDIKTLQMHAKNCHHQRGLCSRREARELSPHSAARCPPAAGRPGGRPVQGSTQHATHGFLPPAHLTAPKRHVRTHRAPSGPRNTAQPGAARALPLGGAP